MIARCIAMLLLALLTVVPAAGEASAVQATMHCAPATHAMADTMAMKMPQGDNPAAARQDCDHGTAHHQMPCAMMGLCTMTGCMALAGIATPQVLSSAQPVAFRIAAALRLDGLALPPLLEPPRA